MCLSGQQYQQLEEALIDAFPTMVSLERMLRLGLERNLRVIAGEGSLQEIVFRLIQAAEAQGWVEDLVSAAHDSNPGNTLLLNFFRRFYLKSDRNVDYIRLRKLLADGNWKDADYETYLVMLKVVGRAEEDYIRSEELLDFPCTDLRTIDSLWVKYSSGRFGFSVQKDIYLSVGGGSDGNFYEEAWKKFGDRVGWRERESWIYYIEVTFDTIAPVGHLPAAVSRGPFGGGQVLGFWVGVRGLGVVGIWVCSISSLASRLVNCKFECAIAKRCCEAQIA